MKNRMKGLFSLLVCLIILSNAFLTVYAGSPEDIDNGSSYARDSINYLFSNKIVSGDEKGNFNPKKSVTRAEAVKMIVNSLAADNLYSPDKPTFKDVPKNHWAYKYVETAYKLGITNGIKADVFGINESCTREQIATFYARGIGLSQSELEAVQAYDKIMEFTDNKEISSWAKPYTEFIVNIGLMKGNENRQLQPRDKITKEQMAVMTDRFINSKERINTFLDLYRVANNLQIVKSYQTIFIASEKPIRTFGLQDVTDDNGGKIQFLRGRDSYIEDRSIVSFYGYDFDEKANYHMQINLIYDTPYGPLSFGIKKYVETAKESTGVLSAVPLNQSQIRLYYPYATIDDSYKDKTNYKITDAKNQTIAIQSITLSKPFITLTFEKPVVIGDKLNISIEGLKMGPNQNDIKFDKFSREIVVGGKTFGPVALENRNLEQLEEISAWPEGPIKIMYNGSEIGTTDSYNLAGDDLLIPDKIFNNFGFEIYGGKAEGYDLETKGVTYTVKPGEKTAFKNVGLYFKPFENLEKYQDKTVQLNAAPEFKDELLLPIGILFDTKGIRIYTDKNTRTLNIRMDASKSNN